MENLFDQLETYPSVKFNFYNSGRRLKLQPPVYPITNPDKFDESEIPNEALKVSHGWKILGYTKNPPFQPPSYKAYAIMFEQEDGTQAWFHFRYPKIKEKK